MQTAHIEDAPKILFVDDEIAVLNSLKRFARRKNWLVSIADSADMGIQALESDHFDIVVSDMRMPGKDGATFLAEVKNRFPQTIRMLLTGYSDVDDLERAVNCGQVFNFVMKPWDELLFGELIENAYQFIRSERERERLAKLTKMQNKKLGRLALSLDKQVKERTIEIEQALTLLSDTHARSTKKFLGSIEVLTKVQSWKDDYDANYTAFMQEYSQKMAEALSLSSAEVENIRIAAALHRIGLMALPDEIRQKSWHSLKANERKLVMQSPAWGHMALDSTTELAEVARIVRHQYECINGKGFPDGLYDRDIPIGSKIIYMLSAFFDCFSGRLEANAYGIPAAKAYINNWVGKKFDRRLLAVFNSVIAEFKPNEHYAILVATSELHEGMVLAKDIVSKKGMLLLSKGVQLNKSTIMNLKNYEKTLNEVFKVWVNIEDSEHGDE